MEPVPHSVWLLLGLVGAIVYFIVSSLKMSHQLTLLLVSIWLYFAFVGYQHLQSQSSQSSQRKNNHLNRTLEAPNLNSYKYLSYNPDFRDIAASLAFVEIFDKARVSEFLDTLDRFQKCYMFILSERYPTDTGYLEQLRDTRQQLLTLLYSFFIIVPFKTEYKGALEQQVQRFQTVSADMLAVVVKFAKTKGPVKNEIELQD